MNKRNRTGAFAGLLMAAAFVGGMFQRRRDVRTAPTTRPPSMAAPSAPALGQRRDDGRTPFGAACSAVPAVGAGSFAGMAADPVATAASNNPVLSTLVTAVTAAGLGDTLNTAEDITVFAPTNDAFAAMDKATLDCGDGRSDRPADDGPDLPRRPRPADPGDPGRDPHDPPGRGPEVDRQR